LTIPDELATRIRAVEDRLPEILELRLREWLSAPAKYAGLNDLLETLARLPSAEEVLALRPTPTLEQSLDAARRSLYYDCVLSAVRPEGSDACIFASREESPRRFHGRSQIRSVRSVWQVC
jgi:hypothetical protein